MRLVLITRILFLLLVLLSGCGIFSAGGSRKIKYAAQSKNSPKLPFEISVTDAINDGNNLYLRAQVNALAAWDPEQVYIRLKGFAEGERHEELVVSLANAIEQQHPQAKAKFIARHFKNLFLGFSLPSQGLTDYQLELVWGPEATASLSAAKEKELVVIQKIAVVEHRECPECEPVAILRVTLSNRGEQAVSAISLEVGFNPIITEQLLEEPVKPNTKLQVVEITDFNLPPETEQDLEFEVDLSKAQDSGFIPVAQILNYELKSE